MSVLEELAPAALLGRCPLGRALDLALRLARAAGIAMAGDFQEHPS
jgi:hypothetical protein